MHNLWLYSAIHVRPLFYTVRLQQISELSVDVESKQKELQSVLQDKNCLEQQILSLVRNGQTHYYPVNREMKPVYYYFLNDPSTILAFF